MSNVSAPGSSSDTVPTRPGDSDRGAFVITMIAIATLLFVATEGLLYYRWATMTEPTCVLIVETSDSLRGAEIQVDGISLPTAHKVIVGTGDRFSIPFYLEPGRYTVKVLIDEIEIFKGEFTLTMSDRGRRLDLTKARPPKSVTTSPSSASAHVLP